MSNHTRFKRAGRIGATLAVGVGILSLPTAAQAAAVNLGTVEPFVVLGGASVTNTGPSVLNGDLGVSPGTSLVGFGLPAVVNGATHNNDAVAGNAKSDLTTAYNVAAGQPVAPADDLTGTNLGNRTLTAGAYRYSTSAQLTGTLTLNAQGNRAVRVRDRLDAHDRRRQCRSVDQRGVPVQRLLAGRELGHARYHHGVPGQPDGSHEHLAEQRSHGDRAHAGPQRLGHAHQQRPVRASVRDLRHAGHARRR
jgi:hypothetical protein